MEEKPGVIGISCGGENATRHKVQKWKHLAAVCLIEIASSWRIVCLVLMFACLCISCWNGHHKVPKERELCVPSLTRMVDIWRNPETRLGGRDPMSLTNSVAMWEWTSWKTAEDNGSEMWRIGWSLLNWECFLLKIRPLELMFICLCRSCWNRKHKGLTQSGIVRTPLWQRRSIFEVLRDETRRNASHISHKCNSYVLMDLEEGIMRQRPSDMPNREEYRSQNWRLHHQHWWRCCMGNFVACWGATLLIWSL